MTSTYSGDPSTSERDRLRFETGDTVMGDPILSDAELDYLLSSGETFDRIILRTVDKMVFKLSHEVSTAIGSSRDEAQQRYEHYKELRDDLRQRQTNLRARPYAGGISHADKRRQVANPDRVAPMFTREDTSGYRKPRP